ncbi:MAG: 30S ribosomal protein S8 [Candidatus Azambacteria bacterium GW2011_GWA1_44_9]|uniref:Small ribosomal subunit protein uS8 n=1 Tax=Candidatus Azambacteria bacterium GW2011_GWA1_44_9 TaxID=1618610 RepID=A0A0G1KBM3_9BACT|nr:MAG: 30S ribosomal protein S8 [Candidatus Azambacteria bacterium GW2011_GWA1_44_9]
MDPISDMLTRIRNAQKAGHQAVNIPMSNLKFEIAKILKKENYVEDCRKSGKGTKKIIEITIKYPAAINEIKRISKPGKRVYAGVSEIKPIKNGYGVSIISTSRGLMTNKEARKSGFGGEILLEIW